MRYEYERFSLKQHALLEEHSQMYTFEKLYHILHGHFRTNADKSDAHVQGIGVQVDFTKTIDGKKCVCPSITLISSADGSYALGELGSYLQEKPQINRFIRDYVERSGIGLYKVNAETEFFEHYRVRRGKQSGDSSRFLFRNKGEINMQEAKKHLAKKFVAFGHSDTERSAMDNMRFSSTPMYSATVKTKNGEPSRFNLQIVSHKVVKPSEDLLVIRANSYGLSSDKSHFVLPRI